MIQILVKDYCQTLPSGEIIVFPSREAMIEKYMQWAQATLTPEELISFTESRERNIIAADLGNPPDPESVSFYERFCSEEQISLLPTEFMQKTFHRLIAQNTETFLKNPYSEQYQEQFDLGLDQMMWLWADHFNQMTTEEQQLIIQAVDDNYTAQMAYTGDPVNMPITTEFDQIWQDFLDDRWVYETQNGVVVDGPTPPAEEDIPPPPPPPDEDIPPPPGDVSTDPIVQ